MSDTTNGKWNVASLKEHFDSLFREREDKVNQRFEAIKEDIRHADDYAHYRDVKANEFRDSLDDLSKRAAEREKIFITKSELENISKQFDIWMSGMKQVQEANFNVCMDGIHKLEAEIEKTKNIKQGSSAVWGYVVGVVGLIIAIIAIVLKFI